VRSNSPKVWVCTVPDCNKSYSLKSNLLQHFKVQHPFYQLPPSISNRNNTPVFYNTAMAHPQQMPPLRNSMPSLPSLPHMMPQPNQSYVPQPMVMPHYGHPQYAVYANQYLPSFSPQMAMSMAPMGIDPMQFAFSQQLQQQQQQQLMYMYPSEPHHTFRTASTFPNL